MSELTTKRTLVKSPPELWAEVSDLEALAKHLGEFGEIRITRLEPETTVVWEGDRACGTVKLEPSGWGTKVTLTAELAAIEAVARRRRPADRRSRSLCAEPEAIEEPPPSIDRGGAGGRGDRAPRSRPQSARLLGAHVRASGASRRGPGRRAARARRGARARARARARRARTRRPPSPTRSPSRRARRAAARGRRSRSTTTAPWPCSPGCWTTSAPRTTARSAEGEDARVPSRAS